MPQEINWDKIAASYKKCAEILMKKPRETTKNTVNGMSDDALTYEQERRLEIIQLRLAAEFLLKSLYIKKGFCIFKTTNEILKIDKLPPEIDMHITFDFYVLIERMSSLGVPDTNQLKDGLHQIRKKGNDAVHGHEFDDSVIINARNTLEALMSLTS